MRTVLSVAAALLLSGCYGDGNAPKLYHVYSTNFGEIYKYYSTLPINRSMAINRVSNRIYIRSGGPDIDASIGRNLTDCAYEIPEQNAERFRAAHPVHAPDANGSVADPDLNAAREFAEARANPGAYCRVVAIGDKLIFEPQKVVYDDTIEKGPEATSVPTADQLELAAAILQMVGMVIGPKIHPSPAVMHAAMTALSPGGSTRTVNGPTAPPRSYPQVSCNPGGSVAAYIECAKVQTQGMPPPANAQPQDIYRSCLSMKQEGYSGNFMPAYCRQLGF